MELKNTKTIAFVVNVDHFFISHRLPLALEALNKGYKVYLLTRDTGKVKQLEAKGINVINVNFERSGKNPIKDFLLINELKKIYKRINPDIIHHITLKPSIYGTIAARSLRSSPRIINAVSGLGYSFTAKNRVITRTIILRLLNWAFKSKTSSFIFQNNDDKKLYDSLGFLHSNNHIIIKGSGVDEQQYTYHEPVLKDKISIVLVARMLKDKGILEFIDAANILRKEFERIIEFVLVGGIDVENPAHIKESDLLQVCDQRYLKWVGHRSEVREVYEKSDIVCLPSYREGLPKSLVEAMAIGRPIITTDAIGCKDCVIDGYNGYLVPIMDSKNLALRIKDLILDKELRLKMGVNSRKKMIEEMTLKKVVAQTFDFYQSV